MTWETLIQKTFFISLIEIETTILKLKNFPVDVLIIIRASPVLGNNWLAPDDRRHWLGCLLRSRPHLPSLSLQPTHTLLTPLQLKNKTKNAPLIPNSKPFKTNKPTGSKHASQPPTDHAAYQHT